jgi:hypothetical protein
MRGSIMAKDSLIPINYSIYTVTHRKTGRTYVGMTSLARPRARLSALKCKGQCDPHLPQSALSLALRNEGVDQFDFKVIETAETFEDAAIVERRLITRLRATSAGVYNKANGGGGNRRQDDPAPRYRRVNLTDQLEAKIERLEAEIEDLKAELAARNRLSY